MLSMGGYLAASWMTYRLGFPLDDAWIHQTYARNLGRLGEWSFVPGQPSAGSTSPLWSILLAAGHALGLGPYIWTYFLGWLLLVLLSALGIWAFRRISLSHQGWAWAAGAILVTEWHLVWSAASGMETLLFATFVLLILTALAAKWENWFLIGVLIGLSVWTRPDGLTLLGPAILALLLIVTGNRRRVIYLSYLIAGVLLLFAPYLLWNRALNGAWWPNTLYAKQAEYAIELLEPLGRRLFEQAILPNAGVGVLLLPGFVITCYLMIIKKQWGALAGAIWAVGYLCLYALRLPVTYQHGRYVMPMMPIYYVWGLVGIAWIVRPSSGIQWKRILSKAWLASIGLVCLVFWFLGARAYGRDVAFIESEMVATARWVSQNTGQDALIAAHDIGSLGYFGQRRLLDLAGLVSPEVIPFIRDEDLLATWISYREASYLITFPSWYPKLTAGLIPIYKTGGKFSQAFDGENMAIYLIRLRLR